MPPTEQTLVTELDLDRTWTYDRDLQHGGHLVEMVTGAALQASGHPHPLATTAHFLSAPRVGPAQVHVQLLRAGRSVSTLRAQLVQAERPCLDVVVTAGRLGPPGPPAYLDGAPPALPAVERCVRTTIPAGLPRNGIVEQLDLRVDPVTVGTVSDRAEVRGWVRYADRRPVDPLALLCLADGLPPVTLALGRRGWVPTVELTVRVRALPSTGWLRMVQRAQLLQDGWLDETCEIWDSTDRLVAQAGQLAGYRER